MEINEIKSLTTEMKLNGASLAEDTKKKTWRATELLKSKKITHDFSYLEGNGEGDRVSSHGSVSAARKNPGPPKSCTYKVS